MAAQKITFEDKETYQASGLPAKNKATSGDYNEIKSVVNANADELDAAGLQEAYNKGNEVNIATLTPVTLNHTAGNDSDAAEIMDVDANGLQDVKAKFIKFRSGAINIGQTEEVILLNIDETDSVDGNILGYQVLSTNQGGAEVIGYGTGVGVNPIRQISGTFSDMDEVDNNGTNDLAAFTDPGVNVAIFTADNDYVTIGDLSKFNLMLFVLNTGASGSGIKPTFEYSTGVGTWATFSPIDGTDGMKNTGVIAWEPDEIPSWAVGASGNYLIRITRTQNTLTTTPIEELVQIVNGVEYSWSKTGDLNIRDITARSVNSVVNVDGYGAVGDGVTDDSAAIQSAIDAGGQNSIIQFSPGKIYRVDNPLLSIYEQKFVGYQSTIKRGDSVKTTTSEVVANGVTSFDVVDSSVFKVGDDIIITDATLTYGGTGYDENSSVAKSFPQEITNITGNTLTVDSAIEHPTSGSFPLGSTVVKVYKLLSTPGFACEIYGLTFDGNKANNTDTYSWTMNAMISKLQPGSLVKDCVFKNSPNETMFVDGDVIVEGCFAYDLNGSLIHVSKSVDLDGPVTVSGNHLHNVSIIDNAISSHGEAAIVASASPTNVNIHGNSIDKVNGYIFGYVGIDTGNINIADNILLRDAIGVIGWNIGSLSNVLVENFYVQNNTIIDCGDVEVVSPDDIEKGYGVNNVIISGNYIKNGRIRCLKSSHVEVSDNIMEFIDGDTLTIPDSSEYYSAILFSASSDFKIINNTIIDYNVTENATLKAAIVWSPVLGRTFIKSDAVTDTKYIYSRNIEIEGNIITGFSRAIYEDIDTGGTGNYSYINVSISRNNIIMRDDADAAEGIRVSAGIYCGYNTIYANSNTLNAIQCYGASSTDAANFNGAIVVGNRIYGGSATIRLHVLYNYNCEIHWNYLTAALQGSSVNSNISNNQVMNVNENSVTLDLLRENPEFY
jgi:hypothetical protein